MLLTAVVTVLMASHSFSVLSLSFGDEQSFMNSSWWNQYALNNAPKKWLNYIRNFLFHSDSFYTTSDIGLILGELKKNSKMFIEVSKHVVQLQLEAANRRDRWYNEENWLHQVCSYGSVSVNSPANSGSVGGLVDNHKSVFLHLVQLFCLSQFVQLKLDIPTLSVSFGQYIIGQNCFPAPESARPFARGPFHALLVE